MAQYPPNVGIVAFDVYFPKTYVSQAELGACKSVTAALI